MNNSVSNIIAPQALETKRGHSNPYFKKLQSFDSIVLQEDAYTDLKGHWNERYYGNNNPLVLEIGTGFGDFLIEHSISRQNQNFIGMDMRFKRSFKVVKKLMNFKLIIFAFYAIELNDWIKFLQVTNLIVFTSFFPTLGQRENIIRIGCFLKHFSIIASKF